MNSGRTIRAAGFVGLVLLIAGCYTVLRHPEVGRGPKTEEAPAETAQVERSTSCSDCHAEWREPAYYHWPFHYYDPPVSSWVYRPYFYGRPFYSVGYYHRSYYYTSYPWWWSTGYHRYRYPDARRETEPKPEPEKRGWDRGRSFDRPLPTVGSSSSKRPATGGATPGGQVAPATQSGESPEKGVAPATQQQEGKQEDEEDEDEAEKKRSDRSRTVR